MRPHDWEFLDFAIDQPLTRSNILDLFGLPDPIILALDAAGFSIHD